MSKTTFIIADPHVIIRKGLASIISKLDQTEILHETDQTDELIKLVNLDKPDILIVNPILLKTYNSNIRSQFTDCDSMKLIFLHPASTPQAKSPANSHISYFDSQNTITKTIQDLRTSYPDDDQQHKSDPLSSRENMILKHIALGLTNKEIADKLTISIHTVVTHRKNITHKLGIKSVSGLTVYAILNNLISLEEVQ